jgi:hypothetical protein
MFEYFKQKIFNSTPEVVAPPPAPPPLEDSKSVYTNKKDLPQFDFEDELIYPNLDVPESCLQQKFCTKWLLLQRITKNL